MRGLAAACKGGLIAGLLVAFRDIPLDAFRLDLQDPVVFVRGSALVIAGYAVAGLLAGPVASLLLSLIERAANRLPLTGALTGAHIGLGAIGLMVVWRGWSSEPTAATVWLSIAAMAVLIETGRRTDLIGLSGPLAEWLPVTSGVLIADGILFASWRYLGERGPGGFSGTVAHLGGLIAALLIGLIAWAITRWLCGLAARRTSARAVGLTVGGVAIIAVAGLAAWQLALGASGLERELSGLPAGADTAAGDSPSVILISVDALRADFTGYAGGDVSTPTMDRIAEDSFVFEKAWSVSPWTRPSFASFFSGVYPSEVGVARVRGQSQGDPHFYPLHWDAERTYLAELLRDAGYSTFAVVTNTNLTSEARADQGFDLYYHSSLHPGVGLLRVATRPLGLSPFSWENLERANVVSSHAARALETAVREPALLWIHYMDPHQPYDPPTLSAAQHTATGSATMAGSEASGGPVRRRFIDAYSAEIEYCDRWLGRLVDVLKQRGLWDSSIVVFWSDHGEEFWEHGGIDHGHTLYDELMRVPLMIHVPGQSEGRRITQPVSLLDVMPTILDLCGIPVPEGCHGRSLQPVLDGGAKGLPPFQMFMEGCRRGSLRKARLDGRYKLIYDVYHDRFSLYDLQEDPREQHDIYGLTQAPETERWESELRAWTEMMLSTMASRTAGGAEEVPPELRQQLRDMGYVQ